NAYVGKYSDSTGLRALIANDYLFLSCHTRNRLRSKMKISEWISRTSENVFSDFSIS
ncbi:hypothetical protein ACJMK2_015558, partial [Sinanodonta woodiana]